MLQDVCLYPFHPGARKLPVYLTGVGSTACQQPICRPEGYFWHQLLLCTDGAGRLTLSGAVHTISAGDCFFLPAGVPHEYRAETPSWGVQWATFEGYAVPQLLDQLSLTKPQIVHASSSASLPSLFHRLLSVQTADQVHSDYTSSGLVYSLLLEFHRLASTVTGDRSELLSRVLSHIDRTFHTDVSLQELAAVAGVTPQHLCRIFREAMHMRPGEYIAQRRIRVAQELIRTTDLPLADIARQVGFASAGYFSTVFRRCVGVPPSQYRSRGGSA